MTAAIVVVVIAIVLALAALAFVRIRRSRPIDGVESFRRHIDALSPEDRFEIIAFNVEPAPAFGALRSSDDAAKRAAAEFLASRSGRGGTVLNPAMTTAYKYAGIDRPLNVIVLSDGMTEQTERAQLVELIRRRPEKTATEGNPQDPKQRGPHGLEPIRPADHNQLQRS